MGPDFVLTQNRHSVNPYREKKEEGGGGNFKEEEEERRFLSSEILLSDLVGKTNGHGTTEELKILMRLLSQGLREDSTYVLEKEIPGLAKRLERLLGKENLLLPKSLFLWYINGDVWQLPQVLQPVEGEQTRAPV